MAYNDKNWQGLETAKQEADRRYGTENQCGQAIPADPTPTTEKKEEKTLSTVFFEDCFNVLLAECKKRAAATYENIIAGLERELKEQRYANRIQMDCIQVIESQMYTWRDRAQTADQRAQRAFTEHMNVCTRPRFMDFGSPLSGTVRGVNALEAECAALAKKNDELERMNRTYRSTNNAQAKKLNAIYEKVKEEIC